MLRCNSEMIYYSFQFKIETTNIKLVNLTVIPLYSITHEKLAMFKKTTN